MYKCLSAASLLTSLLFCVFFPPSSASSNIPEQSDVAWQRPNSSSFLPTGLHRWQHGYGVLPFGSERQRQPTRQRGMDAAARRRLLWPSGDCRVRRSRVSAVDTFFFPPHFVDTRMQKCGARVFVQGTMLSIVCLFVCSPTR